MTQTFHATVLNLHQPLGNLDELLDNRPWEAKEILYALDRMPRALEGYEDVGRVHAAFSGSLLETLVDPRFQERVYGIVKCGDLLWRLRTPAIEPLATGYYHPVLPLIPQADREEQIRRWLGIARHVFDRWAFTGFWPPEMGFSMDMIPMLKRFGFRYVLVDSDRVEAVTPMDWAELRYRPHLASYADEEIVVIVRDRELSNAQEAGMDPDWFANEAAERTKHCGFPALITTCSDGDNGGWFRNTDWSANFWGAFYRPLLDRLRQGTPVPAPIFIHEYLDRFGAAGYVTVHTGAWNTGDHDGAGFIQWTGSGEQRDALERLTDVSREIHDLRWSHGEHGWPDPAVGDYLEQAMWRLLRAETSCNFYWGADWVPRCHRCLDEATAYLHAVREREKG
jgi:alpha-amylase/alpha-mannosidase (GH57 family)